MRRLQGLTSGETFILSWQYPRKWKRSSQDTRLACALATAGPDRFAVLRVYYPEEADALERFRKEPGWWMSLLVKAVDNGLLPSDVLVHDC